MPWSSRLDTAIDLYNAEEFEEYSAHIKAGFRDTTPNYAHGRYYSLLACCLDEWYGVRNMKYLIRSKD